MALVDVTIRISVQAVTPSTWDVIFLQVPNHSTSMTYNLRPVIDGIEYWSGPDTLIVPPQSTKYYELTYHPMTMTADGKKHTVESDVDK